MVRNNIISLSPPAGNGWRKAMKLTGQGLNDLKEIANPYCLKCAGLGRIPTHENCEPYITKWIPCECTRLGAEKE